MYFDLFSFDPKFTDFRSIASVVIPVCYEFTQLVLVLFVFLLCRFLLELSIHGFPVLFFCIMSLAKDLLINRLEEGLEELSTLFEVDLVRFN